MRKKLWKCLILVLSVTSNMLLQLLNDSNLSKREKRSSLSFVTQSQHHCCELIFAQLIKGATRSKRVLLWHEFVYFAVFTWVPHWPKLSNLTLGTVSIRAGTRTQPPPTSNINQQKYSKASSKMKQDWCLETIVWSSLSKTKSRPKISSTNGVFNS